jgi:hypothetical protein
VHALRPWACRSYPLVADFEVPGGAQLLDHACCPDDGLAAYGGATDDLLPTLEADRGEEMLYLRMLLRWEQAAWRAPVERPIPVGAFVDWLCAVYDAIEPLRQGERGDWQLSAYALVDRFPLPSP